MEAISVINVDEEEDEDWEIGLFKSSRRTLHPPPSGEEENDEDEEEYDGNVELGCPYCAENFDILGLCCHIDDQHFKDATSGVSCLN